MASFDIVYDKSLDASNYGFRNLLVVGTDIHEYSSQKGKLISPSFLRISSPDAALKAINAFDYFYLTSYDANIHLISKVTAKKKKFIINVSDLFKRDGIELSRLIYRISQFTKYCDSYRAGYVFVSLARDEISMRSARELKRIEGLLKS